ncbi:lysophospholipid acyltransferase family protein [Endothiovibrio diazotrophicus]
MILIRSALFNCGLLGSAIFFSLLTPLLLPFPYSIRFNIIKGFALFNVASLKWLCGVGYRIDGLENLPAGPGVLLSKHQSAWETLAFQKFFPPHSWLLKRELIWIPFLGWGLWMMRAIAIDRSAGRKALKLLIEKGKKRLQQGQWVMIFPEGTRVPPGTRGTYHQGGAVLASKAAVPVVPIAHNAGQFWPKGSFLKYPGTVRIVVGPAIDPAGKSSSEITREVEEWIESKMEEISS